MSIFRINRQEINYRFDGDNVIFDVNGTKLSLSLEGKPKDVTSVFAIAVQNIDLLADLHPGIDPLQFAQETSS